MISKLKAVILVSTLVIALLLPVPVFAAGPAVVTAVGPSQSVGAGQQFTVNIDIVPNNAIAGSQFNLSFNASLVTANSLTEGNLLRQGGANTYFNAGTIDNVAGTISGVSGAIITPGQTVSAAGTFAVVTMTSKSTAGTCPLNLSSVIVGDINGQAVAVTVVNGQAVIVVNQAPVLAAIGNKSVNEGQALSFTISATDPDGTALTYSASSLPAGAAFNTTTRAFSWTPAYSQSGTYAGVHFQVSDGSLTDSEDITITVNNVNQAPVLAAIGNKSVNEGQALSFTISATDPDGTALTYSASSLPTGAAFNATTRTFSWTPTYSQSGTYAGVHFQVSDGSLTDSEDITITVNNVNQAPVLAAIGNKSVNEGQALSFTVSATDADGTALTYSASSLPTGAAFNATTRTFSWTPTYSQSGTYASVHFQVGDGSLTDSEDITITVAQPYTDWDPNIDGSSNVLDLILIGQHWGETGASGWIREDSNGDGAISVLDNIVICQHWTV